MISRQNYLEMAAIFRRMRPDKSSRTKYKEWLKLREAFIDCLYKDNPNFDKYTFRMHTEVNLPEGYSILHTPGGNIINLKDK